MSSLLLAVALAAPPVADLEAVAAALRASPAWEATFTQRYVPAGFTRGTEESGTLLLRPPDRVRFEYSKRVFAVRDTVARLVDLEAGTCEAVRLAQDTLDRLPLAAVLDPGAARSAFQIEAVDRTLILTPRRPTEGLSSIEVRLGGDNLPAEVVVHDTTGDRNEFRFQRWRRRSVPPDNAFSPSLPGELPCIPEDG